MSRHGYRSRPTSARRLTAWALGPADVNGGFTTSAASLWSLGVTPGLEGLTLVRTRGLVSLTLGSATGSTDGFFGALGLIMVTDEALAAGVTAVPTPLSDENFDGWLWHSYFDLRLSSGTLADGVNGPGAHMRVEVDSKAMRKFSSGMTMIGVTEVVESGTATMEVQSSLRCLFKLP